MLFHRSRIVRGSRKLSTGDIYKPHGTVERWNGRYKSNCPEPLSRPGGRGLRLFTRVRECHSWGMERSISWEWNAPREAASYGSAAVPSPQCLYSPPYRPSCRCQPPSCASFPSEWVSRRIESIRFLRYIDSRPNLWYNGLSATHRRLEIWT